MGKTLKDLKRGRKDCCVCDCLIHPYHSDCGACGCHLYEDEDLNVDDGVE